MLSQDRIVKALKEGRHSLAVSASVTSIMAHQVTRAYSFGGQIVQNDRITIDMVHRNVKVANTLARVQIHRQHPVSACTQAHASSPPNRHLLWHMLIATCVKGLLQVGSSIGQSSPS